jgi:ribonuclease HI
MKIYTDGASRGNPGHSGAGGVIIHNDDITHVFEYIGIQTNNYAEYYALQMTLKKAIEMGIKNVTCYMDSSLVVNQMNGLWKVNHPNIKQLYNDTHELISQFEKINFVHIFRDSNKLADELANKAIDNYLRKNT